LVHTAAAAARGIGASRKRCGAPPAAHRSSTLPDGTALGASRVVRYVSGRRSTTGYRRARTRKACWEAAWLAPKGPPGRASHRATAQAVFQSWVHAAALTAISRL